jgi:glycosyltransferase involved in cell wall biosynthesis
MKKYPSPSLRQHTVLFTIDSFETGGVTSFIRLYARAIKKMGGHSVILGYRGNISNPNLFFRDSTTILIPKTIQTPFWNRCIGVFMYTNALRRIYRSHKISLVHFSTTWSTIYALLCPATWGHARISTFYGAYHLEEKSERTHDTTRKEKFGDLVKKYMQYVSLLFSQEIITFSQYASSVLTDNFPLIKTRHIHIIPGYISADSVFGHNPTHRPTKKSISLINIGRAEPRKGIGLLLQTAAYLKSIRTPFSLTIAGPVYYYQAFDALRIYEELHLLDSVKILHNVDEHDKDTLFKRADLFVMPSISLETFGLSVIESLAHGVPVVVTPTGALPEIMSQIHPNLVSRKATPKSIAKQIIWYAHLSPKQRQVIIQKCIKTAKTTYSETRWQDTLVSLYESRIKTDTSLS